MSAIHKEIYSDMILKVKCGSYQGRVIKAKPVFILTIINMIENCSVKDNMFLFDKATDNEYKKAFLIIGEKITPLFKPFYYLQNDGFWHFKWLPKKKTTDKPSAKYIKESIEYAYLDNALWDLLQDQEMRNHFRTIIENCKHSINYSH